MSKRTILVADHDVPLLQALAVRLRSEQYEVVLAQDADQARQRAGASPPDLVILNIDLRTADGVPGRADVEAGIDRRTTPVIYLADGRSLRHEETARTAGAFGLLTKPFEPGDLVGQIRAALAAAERCAARRSA